MLKNVFSTPLQVSYLYRLAGGYGLLVLIPQFFMEEMIGVRQPPPISHPEFFYGFLGVATAWQVAFFIIASNPVRYRPIMIAGILEKLSFGIAGLVLYQMNRVAPPIALGAFVDLLFAAGFCAAYRNMPKADGLMRVIPE